MARRFPPEFLDGPESPAAPSWQPGGRRSFVTSLRCAWDGLRYAFSTQPNLRTQLGLAGAALGLGWLLRLPAHELALIFALSVFVIYAELVNTAIEHSLNHHVGLAYNPSVKLIKDMAAGSVLIVALAASLLGAVIVLPRLAPFIQWVGLSTAGRTVLAAFLLLASAAWSWRRQSSRAARPSRLTARLFDPRIAGMVAIMAAGTALVSLV